MGLSDMQTLRTSIPGKLSLHNHDYISAKVLQKTNVFFTLRLKAFGGFL